MSVCLVAEPYRDGKYWCKIRHWDGIDQPERTRVFEITEKEEDFEGGRFKKMKFSAKGYKHKIVLPIDPGITPIDEVITWVGKNITRIWHFDISTSYDDCFDGKKFYEAMWMFHFKNEEDAVAFKLRWV